MKRTFKNIVCAIAVFLITTALAAPALADEPVFTDITKESPYYEAVQYFSGQNIIKGTKDRLFHPESEMTLSEWTAILSCITEISETDLLTGNSASVSVPAIIYSSIWQIAGIRTYTAHDYGFASNLDAGTTAMLVTGLIDKDAAVQTSISRGDALNLLYEVAIRKTVTEVPSNLIAFFDVSTDCEDPEETEALLRKLLEAYPNNQLALMLAYDYRFEIWDDLSSLPVEHSDTLLGLEDDGQHIIYLEKDAVSEWALHEVGHAVETCNCSYSKSIALNKAERSAGIELMGKYAGVNTSEFIAEASSYFMKNQDNKAELQAMKEKMPQTYEHFTKLVSAEPFLSEKYFFTTVCP